MNHEKRPTITEIIAAGLDACVDPKKGWGAEHERAKNLANAAPELLACVKAQHVAIDILMARLIERDPGFLPSKSPVWPMVAGGHALIKSLAGITAAGEPRQAAPAEASPRLFLVVHDEDGENLDLFVTAAGRVEAIDLWRAHYDLEEVDPTNVFNVPLTGFESTTHEWAPLRT